MAPDVASALARLGRREHWVDDDDLVFPGGGGGYLDGSAMRRRCRRRYKAALAVAGLRPLRFHDLRHTFGTRIIAKADIRNEPAGAAVRWRPEGRRRWCRLTRAMLEDEQRSLTEARSQRARDSDRERMRDQRRDVGARVILAFHPIGRRACRARRRSERTPASCPRARGSWQAGYPSFDARLIARVAFCSVRIARVRAKPVRTPLMPSVWLCRVGFSGWALWLLRVILVRGLVGIITALRGRRGGCRWVGSGLVCCRVARVRAMAFSLSAGSACS